MSNFKIVFDKPWLLLLMIPAAALLLWTYFKANKKYRRTRNRIVSLVLLMIVMLASINLLAGVSFAYTEVNKENEIILLVDVSYSNGDTAAKENQRLKNEFVKSVTDGAQGVFKIGIITFAKEPNYVAPLSYDTQEAYNQYENSLSGAAHDKSSTNIAAALTLATECFSQPQGAKIVIISDGLETDGNAMSVVLAAAAQGIRIDTALFTNEYDPEIQINGIVFPDANIEVDKAATFNVTVQNSLAGVLDQNGSRTVRAKITLIDNGRAQQPVEAFLQPGSTQNVPITYTFTQSGPHEICFKIETEGDANTKNNIYYTYIYLHTYEKLLILEKFDNESSRLYELLTTEQEESDGEENDMPERFKDVTVLNIDNAPDTLRELREYDTVILMNIANADMPAGFDENLSTFVKKHGGGLLTIGGDEVVTDVNGKENTVAHAYNRKDMNTGSSYYRSLLPVNCIEYTPPLALMIVVDCSQSMESTENSSRGKMRIDLAKDAAEECVNALSDRDYCGVVSFGSTAKLQIGLTPKSEQAKILSAISSMTFMDQTYYEAPLLLAYQALAANVLVENRHIIFITDGLPKDDNNHSETIEKKYLDLGITLSTILIHSSETAENTGVGMPIGQFVKEMSDAGRGNYMFTTNPSELPALALADLKQPSLQEYVAEEFTPVIKTNSAPELAGLNLNKDNPFTPVLGGFYGTKIKENDESVEVILADKYVPIYARWKQGEGKVGSFMSSLSSEWADDFLKNEQSVKFIFNMIRYLCPSHDLRSTDIEAEITPKNYSTEVNVIPLIEIEDGQTTTVTVKSPTGETLDSTDSVLPKTTLVITLDESFRCVYPVYQPGIYEIAVEMKDINGKRIAYYETQLAFSYSLEYNAFVDTERAEEFMTSMAARGKGEVIAATQPDILLKSYNLDLEKNFNPWLILIITAIVLFLLNIAVRKFKWRWPHEIIRDRKAKILKRKGV